MKNREFNTFIHILAAFVAGLLCIIASSGAISSGGIYAFAGIVNFGWLVVIVRWATKYIMAQHEQGATSKGAASAPVDRSEGKADEERLNNND